MISKLLCYNIRQFGYLDYSNQGRTLKIDQSITGKWQRRQLKDNLAGSAQAGLFYMRFAGKISSVPFLQCTSEVGIKPFLNVIQVLKKFYFKSVLSPFGYVNSFKVSRFVQVVNVSLNSSKYPLKTRGIVHWKSEYIFICQLINNDCWFRQFLTTFDLSNNLTSPLTGIIPSPQTLALWIVWIEAKIYFEWNTNILRGKLAIRGCSVWRCVMMTRMVQHDMFVLIFWRKKWISIWFKK